MEEKVKKMLNSNEAALYLNVTKRTLLKWSKKGDIKAYRLGKTNYYRTSDLDSLFVSK